MTGEQNIKELKELIQPVWTGYSYTINAYVQCRYELLKEILELIERQDEEIDILIRKKETLRDEICELQTEINRLKDFEHIYDDLCCQVI